MMIEPTFAAPSTFSSVLKRRPRRMSLGIFIILKRVRSDASCADSAAVDSPPCARLMKKKIESPGNEPTRSIANQREKYLRRAWAFAARRHIVQMV